VRYYEDLPVGTTSENHEATYLVTEEEILEVGRRWDPQPFHTDPVAAAASPFGGLVASSVHLFAIAVSFGVKGDPTAAVSSLGFQELVNHAPARPGDLLRGRSTVQSRRQSTSRPELGVIGMLVEVMNQDDEIVFSFANAFLVRCREGSLPIS
jgi:acyl dehydratase